MMSFILHLFIVAAYSAVAIAAAIVLPRQFPVVPVDQAPLVAGFIFVLAAFLHIAVVQGERHRMVQDHLAAVRDAYRRLLADVDLAHDESRRLREAMTEGAKRDNKRMTDVAAEVQVLQNLIERFHRTASEAETNLASRGAGPALVSALSSGATGQAHEALVMPPVMEDIDDQQALAVLREGLRLDRVDVYLQPVVSLPQRKTRYYECFTRVRDDAGSVIVPEQYIHLARREGLVSAIDNMLLFRCVQLIRRTQRRNFSTLFFCNISHDSLADAEFFDDFLEFMAENDDLAPMIVFEFRQRDVQEADNLLLRKLGRLAELGFRFSLDGVTHFNMNYRALGQAQFRFLRLDAATVLAHLNDRGGDVDVRDLKRRLDREGIDLIVEKIETEGVLRELLDLNIDFGQGYLFGEPRLSRDD